MNKIVLTLVLVVALCSTIIGQSDPISLKYNIGEFRISSDNNQQLIQRFGKLDPDKTYVVQIIGSADFLGSENSNLNLSNKRVKFAEYHLLQHFGDRRLIIKLNSKGEMSPEDQLQTPKGIQEHRIVHIYINEYDASEGFTSTTNTGSPTTLVTKNALMEEGLRKKAGTMRTNDGISKEASSESREQLDLNSVANPPAVTNNVVPSEEAYAVSAGLKLKGEEPLRSFDGEGSYKVGDKLLLSDMNFRPGSHYLRPSSISSLRKLIQVMEDNPNLKIEIRGHICCHPNNSPHPDGYDRDAGNNMLSFNRANNIKDYLIKNEIDGTRITAVGMGAKERLVYPEETDEDRTTNRRVEIIVKAI
ncbi:MAG: OmpA family protein [Bacteroidia bacterium]|nr:OmpA family protein [Bacteroidia bacterium]